MNSLCRVCLASDESFKFASIFDNGGKNATEIFLLSGLRMMHLMKERDNAIICPECVIKLDDAIQLRTMCLDSSKYFQQLEISIKNEPQDIIEEEEQIIETNAIIYESEDVKEEDEDCADFNEFIVEYDSDQQFSTEEVLLEEIYEQEATPDSDEEPSKPFINCSLCEKSFKTEKVLKIHLGLDHMQKVKGSRMPVKCHVCSRVFGRRFDLLTHIRIIHEHRRDFQCEFCKQSFGTNGNLTRHIRVKHSDAPLPKPLPPKQKKMYITSPKQDKVKPLVVCDMCGKPFAGQALLRSHISIHHLKEQRQQCTICNAWINSFRDMRKHMTYTHGIPKTKKQQCNECGKAFWNKTFLERHIRGVHRGDRPYICEFCGKGWLDKNSLRVHTHTHTGEKPYACQYCEKTYRRGHHLKKHQRSQHKELLNNMIVTTNSENKAPVKSDGNSSE